MLRHQIHFLPIAKLSVYRFHVALQVLTGRPLPGTALPDRRGLQRSNGNHRLPQWLCRSPTGRAAWASVGEAEPAHIPMKCAYLGRFCRRPNRAWRTIAHAVAASSNEAFGLAFKNKQDRYRAENHRKRR